jgi:hypothetical protein
MPLISLGSPIVGASALAILAATVLIALVRRPALPTISCFAALAGAMLLTLASAEPAIRRECPPDEIAVMVDVSPSTRGAAYHDPRRLTQRVSDLLGDHPRRFYQFASKGHVRPSDPEQSVVEVPVDRSGFAPPASVSAVLLFSDGQFELPDLSPRTYAVIDPALEATADASVTRLEVRGADDAEIAVTTRSHSPERGLTVDGTRPRPTTVALASGDRVIMLPRDPEVSRITASISQGDRWPENDALTLIPLPPEVAPRWWIGARDPGAGWRAMNPGYLPTDANAYLAPAVIVLDNVSADELSPEAQRRLEQYVRDLGGSLLILGGDRAFGAGGYLGTALERLSPLSSAPPEPRVHWILLIDSSGSMAAPAGDGSPRSRWQRANEALLSVLPSLPPRDPVRVGSFARDVRWRFESRPAEQALALSLPPPDISPGGPTNLQPALQQLASRGERLGSSTQVLVLSDADASIDEPAAIADALMRAGIRVHLLATAPEPLRADNPVARLVSASGGRVVAESDSTKWAQSLRKLLRAAQPDPLDRSAARVTFATLPDLSGREVAPTNRTWPKDDVEPLAQSGDRMLGARQRVGLGEVLAMAFSATPEEATALTNLVSRAVRDPRFSIVWETGSPLRVRVDAVHESRYLNGLALSVNLADPQGDARTTHALPQVAPGRYELALPAPREPRLATVVLDGRAIGRVALAGRYAPEFDAIGNNRANLRSLAERTGGRVIEPDDRRRIEFEPRYTQVSLATPLSVAGAVLLGVALITWRNAQ